ncbi:activated Cdc42 kinase-like isoform X2 [Lineus longissimus]|uniref:activated Cdc42 kinase-like isoform X2 n=1 Tax=Lineus longissimus TaxID=88925 RepID=UPI00315D09C3
MVKVKKLEEQECASSEVAPGRMGTVKDLYEFLVEAELQHYYNAFKNDLKVTSVGQLKYVEEEDLADMGMSKPEQRRLKKFFKKECPQGAFGKIRKRMSMRVDGKAAIKSSPDHRPAVKSSKHIIPLDSITILKNLGEGEFGVVQQGIWTNEDGERIQVAIKRLNKEKMEPSPGPETTKEVPSMRTSDFLREVTVMHTIDHENIVRMFGVVLDKDCLMLVTELAPLRSLLECLKEPNLRLSFPVTSLCDFAQQIADGMKFLESKRLIHRDLAARNALVFAKDRVKISDFGLSRALGLGKDYYQTNFNVNLKLPIAWCAPECINYLKFTSSSDVWAFGVTMWEMFSYGFQPWAAMTGQQILDAIDKPNCQRLEMPDCCPKEYYNAIMVKCWEHEPTSRPKFSELVTLLPQIKPEQVKAIKDSPPNLSSKDYLEYKAHDIITVLDKRPQNNPELYRGCLITNGKTGLFNPGDVVPYAEMKHMSPVYRKTKINRKESMRKSTLRGPKISADMISGPQNDLRHTGHIGYDGAMFGDISFIGDEYTKLPVKVSSRSPNHMNGSSASLSRNEQNSVGTPSPVHVSHSDMALFKSASSVGGGSDRGSDEGSRWSDTLTDVSSMASVSTFTESQTDTDTLDGRRTPQYEEVDEDDDFNFKMPDFDFKMPDMSSDFDLGPSLMDEVFKALSDNTSNDRQERALKAKEKSPSLEFDDVANGRSSGPTSPTKHTAPPNGEKHETRLKKFKHKLVNVWMPQAAILYEQEIKSAARNESKNGGISNSMKPMSASEEREIDNAIALANEFAALNAADTIVSTSPHSRTDSESGCESPRSKLPFKLPTLRRSPKPEKPSFSDEMANISDASEELNTPEAQEAYNLLVARGSGGSGPKCESPSRRERPKHYRQQRVKRQMECEKRLSDSDADSRSTSSSEGRGRNSLILRKEGISEPESDGSSHNISKERSPCSSIPEISTFSYERSPVSSIAEISKDRSPVSSGAEDKPECPVIPPKPTPSPTNAQNMKTSPFTSEGKSFISAPMEIGTLERKRIGNVELKSIEHVQASSRISLSNAQPLVKPLTRRPAPDPKQESGEPAEVDTNPLRRLRSGNAVPVFRATARTAGARKFSCPDDNASSFAMTRRKVSLPTSRDEGIGAVDGGKSPNAEETSGVDPPPLPPRDRSRPTTLNTKPRQRKYPLVIDQSVATSTYQNACPNGRSARTSDEDNFASAPEDAKENGDTNGNSTKTGYTMLANCTAEQLGFLDDLDPFWSQKVTFDGSNDLEETDGMPKMTAKYKMPDSNVSYEDLLDFALDKGDSKEQTSACDEVRLMQRVLSKEVTIGDCLNALDETRWDVHNAIKYVKLRQVLSLQCGDIDVCKEALLRSNWDVAKAANFMIEHPLTSPECVDV